MKIWKIVALVLSLSQIESHLLEITTTETPVEEIPAEVAENEPVIGSTDPLIDATLDYFRQESRGLVEELVRSRILTFRRRKAQIEADIDAKPEQKTDLEAELAGLTGGVWLGLRKALGDDAQQNLEEAVARLQEEVKENSEVNWAELEPRLREKLGQVLDGRVKKAQEWLPVQEQIGKDIVLLLATACEALAAKNTEVCSNDLAKDVPVDLELEYPNLVERHQTSGPERETLKEKLRENKEKIIEYLEIIIKIQRAIKKLEETTNNVGDDLKEPIQASLDVLNTNVDILAKSVEEVKQQNADIKIELDATEKLASVETLIVVETPAVEQETIPEVEEVPSDQQTVQVVEPDSESSELGSEEATPETETPTTEEPVTTTEETVVPTEEPVITEVNTTQGEREVAVQQLETPAEEAKVETA